MHTMNKFFFVCLLLVRCSAQVWKHIKKKLSATANMGKYVSTQCYCNKRRASRKCELLVKKKIYMRKQHTNNLLLCAVFSVGRWCVCVCRSCMPFFALILFCSFKCNVGNRCHSSVQSNNVFLIFFYSPFVRREANLFFIVFRNR